MTLTTFTVPDPAPGVDWTLTIPGINLVAVQTIVGRLRTDLNGAGTVNLIDYSGNGADGLYGVNFGHTFAEGLNQPGAVFGNAAALLTLPGPVPIIGADRHAATGMDWSNDYTIESWWRFAAAPALSGTIFTGEGSGFTFGALIVLPDGTLEWLNRSGEFYQSVPGCVLFDDAWHHYVFSFPFAGHVAFYRDGVLVATFFEQPIGARVPGPATDVGYSIPNTTPDCATTVDEFAVYPSALSGAQVAAHYAKRGDIVGYTLAVLNDIPAFYFHFDELPPSDPRLATLEVLNGATLLGQYPAPGIQPYGADVQYTWFADARGTPGSATPQVVTVGVPPLVLPPGYVLQSNTRGIQPTDQWSGIRVLWDDALQNIGPGYSPYDYPPGAFLQYQQVGG